MPERYDVIVVGGGTAGCVIAGRLSEDPRKSVLLIERGPDPRPIPEVVSDPAQARRIRTETDFVARYPTRRNFDGSPFDTLAARVMGGGSTINLMSVTRPIRADFDAWAAAGNPAWSWEEMLPVMKRMETDRDFPDSPLHGDSGPLHLARRLDFSGPPPLQGIEKALVEGAASLGLPVSPDQNGPEPFGISRTVANIKDGRRHSALEAYLEPARSRKNLQITAEAQVLSLQIEKDRVTGVRYEKDGRAHSVSGGRVVLSAGVYHSPQILMLSGIGPRAELDRRGIRTAHALEGVGGNLQDHAVVTMRFEVARIEETDWLVPGFVVNGKSSPGRDCLDFHVYIRPPLPSPSLPLPLAPARGEDGKSIYPITVHLLEQRTRGNVTLKSADPRDPPGIDTRMLEDPEDAAAMVSAMRLVERLAGTGPMREFYGPLLQPGPKEDWAVHARSNYDSFRHGVGTCAMGPASSETAVVDSRLRVHGMENLYVADASVIPVLPHAHTNHACMMIAERFCELLVKTG